MQIKPLHIIVFISLLVIVIFNIYTISVLSSNANANTKSLATSIRSITVQIDSINSLTQSRLDSVQIITNKKTEIQNFYTQRFYEIDSLYSDTTLIPFIKLQLQHLRTVKQLHN